MYKGFGRKSNNLLGHKNLRLGKRVHISVVKRGRLATFHCENWKYFQDILIKRIIKCKKKWYKRCHHIVFIKPWARYVNQILSAILHSDCAIVIHQTFWYKIMIIINNGIIRLNYRRHSNYHSLTYALMSIARLYETTYDFRVSTVQV